MLGICKFALHTLCEIRNDKNATKTVNNVANIMQNRLETLTTRETRKLNNKKMVECARLDSLDRAGEGVFLLKF